jgi:hypothetical protein
VGQRMRKRYEWEIDPEEALRSHHPRAARHGSLARFAQGYDVEQIANDTGASRQAVEQYMRSATRWRSRPAARLRLIEKG